MKRTLQSLTVAVVLRIVHAAIVELYKLDDRVARELDRLPDGSTYAIHASASGPHLYVEWKDAVLRRVSNLDQAGCAIDIKSMPLAFSLFTGQMGLAQGYARHAFSVAGDVSDVMRLARLISLVEAYLFPKFMTRRILTDVPPVQCCPLRVYARLAVGFLTGRYQLYSSEPSPF